MASPERKGTPASLIEVETHSREEIQRFRELFSDLGLDPQIAESVMGWENASLVITEEGFTLGVYEDENKAIEKAYVDFNTEMKHLIVARVFPYKEVVDFDGFDMEVGMGRERYDHDLVFRVNFADAGERNEVIVWVDKDGEFGVEGNKFTRVGY